MESEARDAAVHQLEVVRRARAERAADRLRRGGPAAAGSERLVHEPARAAQPAPRVWAIGGGKGGIGKTVVASSLALAFARRGRRCVLVDADLGAANLHTLFGVEEPRYTLTHFLSRDVEELRQVAWPTGYPHLWLVSGAHALPGAANPSHAQKQKLIRHVRRFPVDDVVLDLSAGSAFTALDLFLAADRGILVVVPEPTAVENAYHFLQVACFRSLRAAAGETHVRRAIDRVLANPKRAEARLPAALIEEVSGIDLEAGTRLRQELRRFQPALVLNKTRRGSSLAWEMKRNSKRHLGVDLEILGDMPWDDGVRVAIERQRPVLDLFPQNPFSTEFQRMVEKHLHQPAPPENTGSPFVLAPGPFLAWWRKHRGKSRAEIAFSLRIREGILKDLEEENYASLPADPYLRSWLSQYAQILELPDSNGIATRYLARMKAKPN